MSKFTTNQIVGELKKRGISLADIGKAQKPKPVSRQYVWQVINGERPGDGSTIKTKIAEIIGFSEDQIFG